MAHCPQDLSLLGHDLRAALSDILGGLNLIDLTTLDTTTLRHVERARVSGETLDRLLDIGLNGLQADAPTVAAQPTTLSTPKLMQDVDLRWSSRAHEKGLSFKVTMASDIPTALRVDHFALERVLSNLIGNAIKFTDHGTVACTVTRENDTLQFNITDTGPGFASIAIAHLFERGNCGSQTGNLGNGLGLHIAKEMADRLQAKLTVRNRDKGGAEVSLTLPLNPAPNLLAHAMPDLSDHRILLADDSATFQLLLGRMLTQMGAEVVAVTDGPSALAALQNNDFDLAMIDIELPTLSGIEVIRQLRSLDAPCAETPIIAVTAHALHDVRASIQSAGANAILPKPVLDTAALGRAIALVLAAPHRESQEMDGTRLQQLLEMAGPATARELISRLHSDLTTAAEWLADGFVNQDWSVLRAQSHVLISVAGVIGATSLQHLAENFNRAAHVEDNATLQHFQASLMPQLADLIRFVADFPLPTDDTL